MFGYALAHHYGPEEKSHPKDAIYYEEVIDVRVRRCYEEEKDVEDYQKGVDVVPAVCEVSLWTNCYDSDHEFSEKEPNEDGIEYLCKVVPVKEVDYGIDTAEQGDETDNSIEHPVLD